MGSRQRPRSRTRALFVVLCIIVLTYFFFIDCEQHGSSPERGRPSPEGLESYLDNLLLNQDQCNAVFPGLSHEIDEAKSLGPFDLPFRKVKVVMQAKIENDQLYIVSAPGFEELATVMLHRQSATINQIYRALKTSPEPMPNVSFAVSPHDQPIDGVMSFARPVVSPSKKRIFPVPHFSFWSWPLPFITSLPAASAKIRGIENELAFHNKDPRPVWRGTAWYNNGAGSQPRLRMNLLKTAGEEPWADVQGLDWESSAHIAHNAINIEDFCRYKYIIHTEGVGYSGRLQFHQLCESVILSPPLEWMQHTTHLVRPVFSSTVLGKRDSPWPAKHEKEEWPVEYPVDEANMIFVASDWSDLEEIVAWLERHEDVAAGIARRQRESYYEGGYLSPAAEVCYWRSLLRGWSEVARPVGEEWAQAGTPFEEYISGTERTGRKHP